jgi:shikimate dehydrogenase
MRPDAKTRLCGIIGNPVEHSLSPAMHNAAYEQLGLNFAYLAFRVTDVEGAIRAVRALDIRGLSVTVPHKVAVIPFLDEIDPVAKSIGAVNTVVNDGGRLKGYNTDWTGFVRSLEAHVPAAGRRVALLGAGGAARAIAFGLKAKGATLTILNRAEEIEMARALAAEIDCPFGDLTQRDAVAGADIVVNATSVGMAPLQEKVPVDPASLRPEQVVVDIVYNPLETRFLREAAARGCRTVPGYEMLLLQGVTQFELWTGKTAPVDLMRSVLKDRLSANR